MFANNEKISERQLTRLMVLDWTGKFCLLLPVLFSVVQGVEEMAALVLAVAGTFFYTGILGYIAKNMGSSFTIYLQERFGVILARSTGLLFFAYLLLNQIYLTRAVGRVSTVFLLPESSEEIIGILFLLAGWITARGSVQKRARTAEVLFPVLAALLIIMLIASAKSVQWANLKTLNVQDADGENVICEAAVLFAAFSGMAVTLYQVPHLRKKGSLRRALKKSVVITGVFQIALFIVMLGAFGKNDLSQLEWPVLVLMSNVNIPGGFLQRWDIIFLSALLFSFLSASGMGIYYMGKILSEVFHGKKEESLQIYCVVISVAVVLIVRNYEYAEQLFARWALCVFLPLVAALPVMLAVLERGLRCKKQKK